EQHEGVDLRGVLEPPEGFIQDHEDVVEVDAAQTLPVQVSRAERQILRWLECRVEQRYPAAVVGDNPPAARLLQFACRHRVPLLRDLIETVLNCGIECRIRSPILMPHPYGIVIDRNAVLGNRVTLMHQVTIGTKHPHDAHSPVIEDNVFIGPGAKILGAVRVGRGATVGANAVQAARASRSLVDRIGSVERLAQQIALLDDPELGADYARVHHSFRQLADEIAQLPLDATQSAALARTVAQEQSLYGRLAESP